MNLKNIVIFCHVLSINIVLFTYPFSKPHYVIKTTNLDFCFFNINRYEIHRKARIDTEACELIAAKQLYLPMKIKSPTCFQ
jgi:hypothetical protein